MSKSRIFRLGDIRCLYSQEINEEFVRSFVHALAGYHSLRGRIATGRDLRESSISLHQSLNETLASLEIEVLDMGICATKIGYFASQQRFVNAAIIVIASHNPAHSNGLKCVFSNGAAMSLDAIVRVAALMRDGYKHESSAGIIKPVDFLPTYYALGFAWDGDGDRCVCFDDEGNLVPTCYLIGRIAEYFLRRKPGSAIVYGTKPCCNTVKVILRHGGQPMPAGTGHAFIKSKMHTSQAIHGGEPSAHHYFGDFLWRFSRL